MTEEDEIVEMTGDDEDDLFGDDEELLGPRAAEELFEGSAADGAARH
jgi:hypothetical protein